MRSILVTRPQPAADELAARLKAEGFTAFCAPLSIYAEVAFAIPDLSGFQALVFTSPQAATLFGRRAPGCKLPVFCVGGATAQAAAAAGFSEIIFSDGGAEQLAVLIAERRNRMDLARLLHVCGEDIAHDLGALLAPEGLSVERLVVYRMDMVDAFPPEAEAALKQGLVNTVPLFSARSAACFAAILKEEKWKGVSGRLELICLSRRVAAQVEGLSWRAVRVAQKPEMESVLAALREPLVDRRASRAPYAGPDRRKPNAAFDPSLHTPQVARKAQRRARMAVAIAATLPVCAGLFLLAPEFLFKTLPPAPVPAPVTLQPRAAAPQAPVVSETPEETAGPIDRARLAAAEGLAGAVGRLPPVVSGPAFSAVGPVISALMPAPEETEKPSAPPPAEIVGADSLLRFLPVLNGLLRQPDGRALLTRAAQTLTPLLDDPSARADFSGAVARARLSAPEVGAVFAGIEPENLGPAALILAFEGLNDGVQRPGSFTPFLTLTRRLTEGAPPSVGAALEALEPYAAQGFGTAESLRAEFQAAAAFAIQAEILARQSEGLWGRTVRFALGFVKIRPADEQADGIAGVLARAYAALGRGETEAALGLIAAVEGPAAEPLKPWAEKARARQAANDTAAMLSQGMIQVLASTAKGESFTFDRVFAALAGVFSPLLPGSQALPLVREKGMLEKIMPDVSLPPAVRDAVRKIAP